MASRLGGAVGGGRAVSGLPRAALWVILLGPASAAAGDWTLTRGVSLGVDYSDNIELSADDPEGDLVAQLNPNVALQGRGRRLTLSFSYSPTGLSYAENEAANDVRHSLSANALLEAVEDIFFISARASASDQVIDGSRASGDPLNITGNTTQAWGAELRPYLRLRHGSFASSALSVTSDVLAFESEDAGDSSGLGFSYALTSGPEFSRLPWTLSLNAQEVTNEDAADDLFQRYAAQLGYVFNREWRTDAKLGWESGDVGSGYGAGEGFGWGTQVQWTPNPRTSGSLTYSDRYFGETWDAAISHRSRRSILGLGYSESLNSSRRDVLDSTLASPQEIAGLLVPGLPGAPGSGGLIDQVVPDVPSLPGVPSPGSGAILEQVLPDSAAVADQVLAILIPGLPSQSAQAVEQALQLFGGDSASLSADVFLQKRLALRYGLNTGRTGIGVSLSHTERISDGSIPGLIDSAAGLDWSGLLASRLAGGAPIGLGSLDLAGLIGPRVSARLGGIGTTETTTAAGVSVSRRLGARVSGQLSTAWLETDVDDSHATQFEVAAGVSRRLSEHASAAVRVRHAQRDASGSADDDYRENRISLTLSTSW